MKDSITLKEWIEEMGTDAAAKALKVTNPAIRNWRCGYVLPSAFLLHQIKKLTKGRLSIDRTFEEHYSTTNRFRIKYAREFA